MTTWQRFKCWIGVHTWTYEQFYSNEGKNCEHIVCGFCGRVAE